MAIWFNECASLARPAQMPEIASSTDSGINYTFGWLSEGQGSSGELYTKITENNPFLPDSGVKTAKQYANKFDRAPECARKGSRMSSCSPDFHHQGARSPLSRMSDDLPSTGHPAVDAVAALFNDLHKADVCHFPTIWLRVITTDSGKPDWSACHVLAEIVYWYRPAVTFAGDGTAKARKRFAADLYHLRIPDLAQKLNLSRQAVSEALERLEELQVIRRHKRHEDAKGRKGNYCFVEIFVDNLRAVSFLDADLVCPSTQGCVVDHTRVVCPDTQGCVVGHTTKTETNQSPRKKTDRQTRASRGPPVGRYPSDEQGAAPPAPPAGRPAVGGLGQQIRSKILGGQTGAGAKTSPASRQEAKRESKSLSGSNGEASQPKADGKLKHLSGDESSSQEADDEQDAAPEGALSDPYIAAELAKVQGLAPKLHQKFFRTPLPSYDPERVAEVLKTHGGKKPALKFIVRLRLAWERIGEVSSKGYKYGRCQRTQKLDHFCKHFAKLWGDVEDLANEYGFSDMTDAYNWLNEIYPELEEELETLWVIEEAEARRCSSQKR